MLNQYHLRNILTM